MPIQKEAGHNHSESSQIITMNTPTPKGRQVYAKRIGGKYNQRRKCVAQPITTTKRRQTLLGTQKRSIERRRNLQRSGTH